MNFKSTGKILVKTFVLLSFLVPMHFTNAQRNTLILDKPGKFNVSNLVSFFAGNCGFNTKEINNYKGSQLKLIDYSKTNPVFIDQKGFECKVVTSPRGCAGEEKYGMPSDVDFLFMAWHRVDGKEMLFKIEPPQFRFTINDLNPFSAKGLNYSKYDPVTHKNNWDKEKFFAAAEKLNKLFYAPGEKRTIGKGIDIYNYDDVVLYNPDRPSYWKQVTIRNLFETMFEYWENEPDEAASGPLMDILKQEYSNFSESEKNGYAYYGNPESVSRICTDSSHPPLLTINPDYWNRSLPKEAIQFLIFKCPEDKQQIREKIEELLKRNDGYYYVWRFMENIDFRSYADLIEK